jgi:hypothetical protein
MSARRDFYSLAELEKSFGVLYVNCWQCSRGRFLFATELTARRIPPTRPLNALRFVCQLCGRPCHKINPYVPLSVY